MAARRRIRFSSPAWLRSRVRRPARAIPSLAIDCRGVVDSAALRPAHLPLHRNQRQQVCRTVSVLRLWLRSRPAAQRRPLLMARRILGATPKLAAILAMQWHRCPVWVEQGAWPRQAAQSVEALTRLLLLRTMPVVQCLVQASWVPLRLQQPLPQTPLRPRHQRLALAADLSIRRWSIQALQHPLSHPHRLSRAIR